MVPRSLHGCLGLARNVIPKRVGRALGTPVSTHGVFNHALRLAGEFNLQINGLLAHDGDAFREMCKRMGSPAHPLQFVVQCSFTDPCQGFIGILGFQQEPYFIGVIEMGQTAFRRDAGAILQVYEVQAFAGQPEPAGLMNVDFAVRDQVRLLPALDDLGRSRQGELVRVLWFACRFPGQ